MATGERVYSGPRVLKLGARPGKKALVVGIDDPEFPAELAAAGVEILDRDAARATARGAKLDLVFLGVDSPAALAAISKYKARLARDGALWVVRPKGKGTPVTERDTMAAGQATGLVDVKVVNFSPTRSALKFVYRLRDR